MHGLSIYVLEHRGKTSTECCLDSLLSLSSPYTHARMHIYTAYYGFSTIGWDPAARFSFSFWICLSVLAEDDFMLPTFVPRTEN